MNRTQMGLLARGLDLHTAGRLADLGCTIGTLKTMGDDELRALGIDDAYFAGLRSGGRPRISADVVAKLLFDNRFICCVCREPDRDVILHHIREWSSTRDDDPANLAVLCLEHHGKAHTRSMMTRNLDPAAISVAKAEWERSCREKDLSAILEATRMSYDAWLYFNHQRLFELANHSGVRLSGLAGFGWAHRHSLVDGDGVLAPRDRSLSWMYEGGEGSGLYAYVRDVLLATLERLRVVNFSDLLERSAATALLAPGDFLIVQGAHRFRRLTDRKSGPGELMRGSRRANDVDIRYTFDRWEATSGSAWATWLTGRQSVASLVQVKSVTREAGAVVVSGTVIAISNGLDRLQKRDYSPRYRRFMSWDLEDDATPFDD